MTEAVTDKKLSRRQFVGTAAAGAAVLGFAAGAPLLAPHIAAGAKSLAAVPLADVKEAQAAVPTKWDYTYGIIVVGTGHAGLAAAIEAYDSGASSVVVIEKEAYLGGTSQFANGDFQMPLNYIGAAGGVKDTYGLAMSDYLTYGNYRSNPALLQSFILNANDTTLWYTNLGLVWNPTPTQQPGNSLARSLHAQAAPNYPNAPITSGNPGQMNGSAAIYVEATALAARNVSILCSKRLTQIYRESGGPVVGIQVLDVKTGTYSDWQATQAVVLATGNAVGNTQMMVNLVHPELNEVSGQIASPYIHNTGDGHICAVEVGAGLIDMEYTSFGFLYGTDISLGPMPNGVLLTPENLKAALSTYGYQEFSLTAPGGGGAPGAWGLLVAGDGNRFINEAIWPTTTVPSDQSANYIAYFQIPSRPRNVWCVVDSNGASALGTSTWSAANFQAASTSAVAPYLNSSQVAYSSTIAGLAQQMQISPTALAATIARWNGFVAAGKDSDFGRTGTLNPISTPPYFASGLHLIGYLTSGGVIVNSKSQVVDCQAGLLASGLAAPVALDNQPVIPGLYAAGEMAGGFFGANRGEGKLGCYTTQGRLAGINAAQEPSNV